MNRRAVLAGTAIGVSTTGVATWFLTEPENDGDENGAQSDPESDGNETGTDTNESGEAPTASEEDVENQSGEQEQEQPEAANPEPEPEGPETNESVINESNATEGPTGDDVTLSDTELATSSNSSRVTGVATNESNEPLTIDLEVTFYRDGEQLGRPALGGTTGLEPGDEWGFSITARGSGVSEATDYEIATHVRTRG